MLSITAFKKRDLEPPRSTVSTRIKRALFETFQRNVELRSLGLKRASQGIRKADGGMEANAFGYFWRNKSTAPAAADFCFSWKRKNP